MNKYYIFKKSNIFLYNIKKKKIKKLRIKSFYNSILHMKEWVSQINRTISSCCTSCHRSPFWNQFTVIYVFVLIFRRNINIFQRRTFSTGCFWLLLNFITDICECCQSFSTVEFYRSVPVINRRPFQRWLKVIDSQLRITEKYRLRKRRRESIL